MKKIYYEKKNKRYVPVREYDSDFLDSFPKGTHIVMCYPGGQSRRYQIDPAFGPMIAAGRYAEDAISKQIMKASDMRPRETPITEEQHKAWEALEKAFGKEKHLLEWPSAREASQAATETMMEEAEKLLSNPAVRKAWDHFMLIAKLVSEAKD